MLPIVLKNKITNVLGHAANSDNSKCSLPTSQTIQQKTNSTRNTQGNTFLWLIIVVRFVFQFLWQRLCVQNEDKLRIPKVKGWFFGFFFIKCAWHDQIWKKRYGCKIYNVNIIKVVLFFKTTCLHSWWRISDTE